MELDCHTMLYNISKKEEQDEHKYSREFFWRDIIDKSKLRIIGENFCRNNKNKGKLIINNKNLK